MYVDQHKAHNSVKPAYSGKPTTPCRFSLNNFAAIVQSKSSQKFILLQPISKRERDGVDSP